LLEPYVTTRQKGTGLGLAIVGRVLEDHGGKIELKDAADFRPGQRGAWMRLRFAVSGHAPKSEAKVSEAKESATKEQAEQKNAQESETKPSLETTNNEPKIEAATTGS
jgi:two-component system, NtrC family, nitrogen regulation sensor histidine kinase NtrY